MVNAKELRKVTKDAAEERATVTAQWIRTEADNNEYYETPALWPLSSPELPSGPDIYPSACGSTTQPESSDYITGQTTTQTQPSTAPSARQPFIPGLQATQTQDDRDSRRHGTLPCEFAGYLMCDEEFDLNESEEWIEHIRQHYNHGFASETVCWFCDKRFVAKHKRDREDMFERRLKHIKKHFEAQQQKWRPATTPEMITYIRPDFGMMHHLGQTGQISSEAYSSAQTYREDGTTAYKPLDWIPPDMAAKEEHELFEPYDQQKEDRERRRGKVKEGGKERRKGKRE
jgi:hypothetical protein